MDIDERFKKALDSAPDDNNIDFDEIPKLTKEKILNGKPLEKIMVSLRLDREIVEYFKSKGPGYQKLMRDTLRQKMQYEKIIGSHDDMKKVIEELQDSVLKINTLSQSTDIFKGITSVAG